MDFINYHGRELNETTPEYKRQKAYEDLCRKNKPYWDKFHRVKRKFDKEWSPKDGAYSDCYWKVCGTAWEELEAKRKPNLEEYNWIMEKLSPKHQEFKEFVWIKPKQRAGEK